MPSLMIIDGSINMQEAGAFMMWVKVGKNDMRNGEYEVEVGSMGEMPEELKKLVKKEINEYLDME